ncbi:DUF6164 family protein [Luteimonas fraxinea]|uniref:DUF6164 family protein n=1 Tax=Luteimonas fraxinea TaxID=2901869 RepID=A0ABS8UBF5_9GAMM|nr:DUF6164 family protein [Luteimonas fraxinea]MCD9096307.1 DUF6164 family protein [Luteimonas fraxinea]MCD9125650.1 DUF6164 family protein [Luteimonas fraxinea]UHH10315.1 DUF6164 family protein [Luteimonas fraxinea]
MAKMLLNLRYVPDDEAADVCAFLDEAGIPWYQTRPSPFGISLGGIWLRENDDLPRAKALMAEYQKERQAQAKSVQSQAERDGTAETFADIVRNDPKRVVLIVIAIVFLIGLMAVPGYMLSR